MVEKNSINKTRALAFCSVMAALVIAIMFLQYIFVFNKISLYVLASFFISIVIIEFGAGFGWIFHISTSLLALVLLPDKTAAFFYLVFFGLYGLVKYYIEKIKNNVCVTALKIIFFNIVAAAGYFIAGSFIDLDNINLPVWIIAVVFEAGFVIYDVIYTMFIGYYERKLSRIIRKK